MPKVDRIVLVVAPEAVTRTNALLTGQVDLIETPAPDLVPRLRQAGARIVENVTPHVWNYHLSLLEGSPWRDLRLRKAANLAINRDEVVGADERAGQARHRRGRPLLALVRQARASR